MIKMFERNYLHFLRALKPNEEEEKRPLIIIGQQQQQQRKQFQQQQHRQQQQRRRSVGCNYRTLFDFFTIDCLSAKLD